MKRWATKLAVLVLAVLLPALASAASLNLTWVDNSTNERGFNIQRKVEACAGTGTFTQLSQVGVNVVTFNDAAVVEGNAYCYRVNAWNTEFTDGTGAVQTSAWSNTAGAGIAYTTASAPTGLTATAAGLLSWTDRTTNETGFIVERKAVACATTGTFAALTTTGASVVTYTDNAVAQGSTYCYRVAAANVLGNSPYSNTVERTIPLVGPAAPGQLGVTLGP